MNKRVDKGHECRIREYVNDTDVEWEGVFVVVDREGKKR